MRSKGFNNGGVSIWELMTETWFRIDKMSILTELFHCGASLSGFITGT